MACQHSPDDQTPRLQAGAGEDSVIDLLSSLDRVDCERHEEESTNQLFLLTELQQVEEVKQRHWRRPDHALLINKSRHPLTALRWPPPGNKEARQITGLLEDNGRGRDDRNGHEMTHPQEASIQHHTPSPDLEPAGEEEERPASH